MKSRSLRYLLLPLMACVSALAAGAAEETAQHPAVAQTQLVQTPAGKLLQAGPLAFRGRLGDDQLQANLRAKADVDEGFEGDYFLFGHSQKVLLAGEVDGDDVFMEESVNGTDVSGQWNGKLNGDTVNGTWQSADGLVTKPFTMKIVRTGKQANDSAAEAAGQAKQ